MASQFGQALLTSPPDPAFGTGAALAIPLLQVPHYVRLDGLLSRSSAGAQVPYKPLVNHCFLNFRQNGDNYSF